ncbi:hypothetical protein AS034_11415 [[Bacillus] enclensis]|uniref:Uncharacterized protein n=1 Tax=[Bacillus] enclensis TaxID=1402860 RepID=A0A0V8HJI3_9BACI|nr:hypothetical protein [[Bacillus] enclensis]KSU62709.1 hypothetical protein AS034_11415 [[Bacillus] enclensis]SCC08353.1 hypothetical protein GA0061094_2365 [[Bacillus] enclensis]
MSFDTIVRMLQTQVDFKESEIVHTFHSTTKTPILSVIYHFDTETFLLTYNDTQQTEKFTNINELAGIIERYLNKQPLEVKS